MNTGRRRKILSLARLNIECCVPSIEIAYLQRAEFAGGMDIDKQLLAQGRFTRHYRPGLRISEEKLLNPCETSMQR